MEIKRHGSQAPTPGSPDYFTGSVRIEPLFQPRPPSNLLGTSVTFEPGARTAWHAHPAGQTLIVTAGSGRIQTLGGPVEEIHPGDVIWIPPGAKHWHGAGPHAPMTHTSIVGVPDGKGTDWMEKVTDAEYGG